MHVTDWVKSKRIRRLKYEIVLLESMDNDLLRKAWYCSAIGLVGNFIFAGAICYLLLKGGDTPLFSLSISAASALIIALIWRYPLQFFALLTMLFFGLILAAIFEDANIIPDIGAFDLSGMPSNVGAKLRRRDKIQSAIAKRRTLITNLAN
jgi:hypothetical protein